MGSIENALNYLLDNFVIIRKDGNFMAYQGYFCSKSLHFPIADMLGISGTKRQPKKNTYHNPNMSYDANRSSSREWKAAFWLAE